MKIAIIAAFGKAGFAILNEAVSRKHSVSAFVRNKNKVVDQSVEVVEKDLFDLSYQDLKDFDVIIDAFGTFEPDTFELHQTSLKHLSNLLKGKRNRLIVVGGAGSLYLDNEHTLKLIDSPDFPEEFKPLALNMFLALNSLKSKSDVNWTYVSPAAEFDANGERTGHYKLGKDELILNSNLESYISYKDFAIAILDEAEQGNFIQQRISVVSI